MHAARLVGRSLCLLLLCALFVPRVQAHDVQLAHTHEREPPSVFEYAYGGLFTGAFVGLGGGYLVARPDGWQKSDWRAVGLGISIGALAGAGLGLSLGFMDRGGIATARYIGRDLSAGAGFGALIGAISGGISAAVKKEPEHVLFGSAIGVVAGAGLGIITGIVEGALHDEPSEAAPVSRAPRMQPSLVYARAPDGSSSWLPSVVGRF